MSLYKQKYILDLHCCVFLAANYTSIDPKRCSQAIKNPLVTPFLKKERKEKKDKSRGHCRPLNQDVINHNSTAWRSTRCWSSCNSLSCSSHSCRHSSAASVCSSMRAHIRNFSGYSFVFMAVLSLNLHVLNAFYLLLI